MLLIGLVFLLVLGSLAIAGSVTLYFILLKFAENIRDKDQNRSFLIFKMCVSLVVLSLISLGMLFPLFWMTLAVNHVDPKVPLAGGDYLQLIAISVMAIGYAFIAWLLVRWMMRRERSLKLS